MIDEIGSSDVGQPVSIEIEDRERQRIRPHRLVSYWLKRSVTLSTKHGHRSGQEIGRHRVEPAVSVQVPERNING